MRPRLRKGTLVASTNNYRHILSRRLIVEVIYNFKHNIVKKETIDVRTSVNQ